MPIQTAHYSIRHLRRTEIEQLLQLCKAEGRHMGTAAEVQSWMQIDPAGFFVAANQEGQIIGSCCGMRLSAEHGYVGMYVVDKAYRGLGIGKQVWDAAMAHLGGRNAGLSAVAHLFTLYRDKAGFSTVADWTVDLYRLENLATALPHCAQHQQKVQRMQVVVAPKSGQKHLNHLHLHQSQNQQQQYRHQHPQHQAPTSPPTQHQLRRKKAKKTAGSGAAISMPCSIAEPVVVDAAVVPSRGKFRHRHHRSLLVDYSMTAAAAAQEVVVLVDEDEEGEDGDDDEGKGVVEGEEVVVVVDESKTTPPPSNTFAELASTFVSKEEFNDFFSLLQQYQQQKKQQTHKSKYLLRASSNSIEQQVSDDESYGFSSLFCFDHSGNKGGGDEDDSGEEVVEVLQEEREVEEEVKEVSDLLVDEEEEEVLEIVAEEEEEEEGKSDRRVGQNNTENNNNSTEEISDLEEEVVEKGVVIPSVGKKTRNSSSSLQLHRPQYSGKLRTEAVEAAASSKKSSSSSLLVEGILAYDRNLHSYDRSRIVRLTLGEEHCLARAALLGEQVVGYGAIKLNLQNMWIVSPLYADSDYIARLLLLDLLADLAFYRQTLQQKYHQQQQQRQGRRHRSRPSSLDNNAPPPAALPNPTGTSVVLKVPSSNRHAATMLAALGFSKQEYSLRRCYTQRLEEVPTQAIYALHTSVFCTE